MPHYPLDELERVYRVNVLAPLALAQLALPRLPDGGCIINVTSDAAVEPYEGWGGYGSSKAALEQLSAILAAEQPALRVYAVDPGDMRTRMHQEAFPGEDISDRPPPEESVPGLLALIEGAPAERALPRTGPAGWRGGGRMTAYAFDVPAALWRRASRPRSAACARDEVRLLVGAALGRLDLASALRRAGATARPRRPAGRQRLGDDPGGGRPRAGPTASVSRCTSRRRRRSSADGWWVVELRTADGGRAAARERAGERLSLDGGADARAGRAVRVGRAADARARSAAPDSVIELPRAPRQPDPLRLRRPPLAAGRLPERLRDDARQRRDGERRHGRSRPS